MAEWEHKVVPASGGGQYGIVNAPKIQTVLDEEEKGGWELVTAFQKDKAEVVLLFFKRPKS